MGSLNTATGAAALASNTEGNNNTATGLGALNSNTTGDANTVSGVDAANENVDGSANTVTGYNALLNNMHGPANTAEGYQALYNNLGGTNIAVGYQAGYNLTTGNANIDIGNKGQASESGAIRIGTTAPEGYRQTATFIAGIYPTPISGLPVVVNSFGQLGVSAFTSSSPSAPGSRGLKRQLARYEAINTKLRSDFLKEHSKVEEQQATIKELQKEMKAVVAQLKEQASQIQKVSTQLEVSKPAPQMVNNNP